MARKGIHIRDFAGAVRHAGHFQAEFPGRASQIPRRDCAKRQRHWQVQAKGRAAGELNATNRDGVIAEGQYGRADGAEQLLSEHYFLFFGN